MTDIAQQKWQKRRRERLGKGRECKTARGIIIRSDCRLMPRVVGWRIASCSCDMQSGRRKGKEEEEEEKPNAPEGDGKDMNREEQRNAAREGKGQGEKGKCACRQIGVSGGQ